MPNSKTKIQTESGIVEGILINTDIPILVIPNLPGGLQMWQGAREILPNARLSLAGVPKVIEEHAGIIIYFDQIDYFQQLLYNQDFLGFLKYILFDEYFL